jgi:SAM-dependent methyltransferase
MLQTKNDSSKIISGAGKDMDNIAGGGGFGWTERWGQEIVTKEIVSRLQPNDIVLDLACGEGRASNCLSMRNIPVIAVDLNKQSLDEGRKTRKKAGSMKVTNIVADIRTLNKEKLKDGPTIIIASDALNHFTKAEADQLINNLPLLLNPNHRGLIYLNVPSTENSLFEYPELSGGERIDERTIRIICDCSGELKEEPMPFFAKGEIEAMLALLGGKIIATNQLVRNGEAILHEVIAEFKPKKD